MLIECCIYFLLSVYPSAAPTSDSSVLAAACDVTGDVAGSPAGSGGAADPGSSVPGAGACVAGSPADSSGAADPGSSVLAAGLGV